MNTPPPEQQNRRTTRSALAEIPTRLGMLSVSDNGRLPSVTATGNVKILWCVSCFQDVNLRCLGLSNVIVGIEAF
jgi:hypothetical protein